MKLGYARVSTQDQDLALQLDALKEAGCGQTYQEKITGAKRERPELQKMLEHLREGDVIVIWKLDRLARSLRDLVDLVNQIQEKGAALLSLNDQIDTTTPHGKFTFHVFAALAEFERDIIRERTKAGLAAARARGRRGGRPKGLSKKAENAAIIAEQLYLERKLSVTEICEHLSVSKSTLYNYLRHRGVEVGEKRKLKKYMKVQLYLRVENNSKFVRDKTKARREIEQDVLRRYDMKKPYTDGWEYILTIPYDTDEELDLIIERDILTEASRTADMRYCFIEADVIAMDGSDRSW
jgi:DNA invertase Pin-like site-specific DNA recombinase